MQDGLAVARTGSPEMAVRPTDEPGDHADEAMLVAAARTDPTAFAALYVRYLPRIHRYLRLRCGSDDVAADLTQDVFLRALAALPRYRERGMPFGAWLFAIARNHSADRARRAKASGWVVPLDESGAATDARWAAPGPGPEEQVLRHEATARVAALVATLDDGQRELLALRFGAGLTSREIGAVVGRSEAAVQKQLVRLLHSLKERSHGR
jgi:RNA polymerase sigma-70 factor (ECF subfamily)